MESYGPRRLFALGREKLDRMRLPPLLGGDEAWPIYATQPSLAVDQASKLPTVVHRLPCGLCGVSAERAEPCCSMPCCRWPPWLPRALLPPSLWGMGRPRHWRCPEVDSGQLRNHTTRGSEATAVPTHHKDLGSTPTARVACVLLIAFCRPQCTTFGRETSVLPALASLYRCCASLMSPPHPSWGPIKDGLPCLDGKGPRSTTRNLLRGLTGSASRVNTKRPSHVSSKRRKPGRHPLGGLWRWRSYQPTKTVAVQ